MHQAAARVQFPIRLETSEPDTPRSARYTSVVDVHLLLLQGEQVLLGRRCNTGYEDGKFHLPAGHLEEGESVTDAAIREAREELGIDIVPEHLEFALVMHNKTDSARIAVFFVARHWNGEVMNREPDKCETLCWFPLNGIPSNIVPYAAHAVRQFSAGYRFALFGTWGDAEGGHLR